MGNGFKFQSWCDTNNRHVNVIVGVAIMLLRASSMMYVENLPSNNPPFTRPSN